MSWEWTMVVVYVGLLAASAFLFRRAPDELQRIAMLILVCAFAMLAVTMLAAALNGYGPELREFLRYIRRTGREFMQTGLVVLLLRLIWKEWVCERSRS